MTRTRTWHKALILTLGGILTASLCAVGVQTFEPKASMTLEAYASQVAFEGDEDVDGWDCRVNGNQTCADGRYVAHVTRGGVALVRVND